MNQKNPPKIPSGVLEKSMQGLFKLLFLKQGCFNNRVVSF